ncbi:hypothetical protein, partial [Frankia sp. CiP3]|uniref:hypothetical protein n=1 Tax=Frankia sp. CiP3 TaxID=2880971 RepID=UPI001EF74702
MPTIDIPEPIRRYFELAAHPDQKAYVDQFAADALVEDEGRNYQGIDAIRSWRGAVPLVTYTIKSIQRHGHGHDARAEIAGDFPGSPVELAFHFE